GWAVHKFGTKDPARERLREGVEASTAVRAELEREVSIKVEPTDATEEQVKVTVQFTSPPADPATRRELVRSANIIVRRYVHHVRELNVLFQDQREVIPSWDGG